MATAAPQIGVEEFDALFEHISAARGGKYQNMQLRKNRTERGETIFNYLHMVRIKNRTTLEGAISGPATNVEYEIKRRSKFASIKLIEFTATSREKKRLGKRLVAELLRRANDEKSFPDDQPVNYKAGRFYLRRGNPGSKISSQNCREALRLGALSQTFLEKLEEWNFQLVYPKS